MQIKRKIQLGAMAVVFNSVFALVSLPDTALANPCTTTYVCYPFSVCPSQSLQNTLCQNSAPAGCTVTSTACPVSTCNGGRGQGYLIACNFN
jgi:hypothetical protein